jgi:uncharacterized protein (TIGR03435 family)
MLNSIRPRAAGFVLAFGLLVATLYSQAPSFEVASVRPIGPIDPGGWGRRPPFPRSSGQFDAADKLRSLIIWAFGVDGTLIEGNFPILDDGFLIAAKAPGPVLLAPRGEVGPMNLMMQSLLADRFKLRVRRELRNLPTYALRRVSNDRLGPNLKPLTVECPPGHPETVKAAPVGCMSNFTIGVVTGVVRMSDFARALSSLMGRHVVDETGLTGAYEIETAFNPQSGDGRFPTLMGAGWEKLPSIADALRKDLGLKLESSRHDFSAVVVESVEPPTEN